MIYKRIISSNKIKKQFLVIQKMLLEEAQRIEQYNKLKREEYKIRKGVNEDIKFIKSLYKSIKLPKVSVPKQAVIEQPKEIKAVEKIDKSIQSQIKSIEDKLRAL